MRTVVWLAEGTWEACVDATRDLPDGPTVLLHVIDDATVETLAGARAGLLGRASSRPDPAVAGALAAAQDALLRAAATRLGRPARVQGRRGNLPREVLAACAEADLLVLARDGDRRRLGPRSLGHATRFVLDHAPCRVLLIWPDEPPDLTTLPPPPHHHGRPAPPPPPHEHPPPPHEHPPPPHEHPPPPHEHPPPPHEHPPPPHEHPPPPHEHPPPPG